MKRLLFWPTLLALLLVFIGRDSYATSGKKFDDPIKQWTTNFEHLVPILMRTQSVGKCTLKMDALELPANSWNLAIYNSPDDYKTLFLIPPAATSGRTQVDYDEARLQYRYRQADAIGWVNLHVRLGVDGTEATGLRLDKTLPDGTVYDVGSVCGDID